MFTSSPFRNEYFQRYENSSTVSFGKVSHIGESAIKAVSKGFISK